MLKVERTTLRDYRTLLLKVLAHGELPKKHKEQHTVILAYVFHVLKYTHTIVTYMQEVDQSKHKYLIHCTFVSFILHRKAPHFDNFWPLFLSDGYVFEKDL